MDENTTPVSDLPVKQNAFLHFFNKLSCKLSTKKYMLYAFFVPMAIMLLLFIFLGMVPLGKTSIFILDMNAQYVYFFEQLRDVILGKASLFYTFERALGGEFLGYFTYYLSSPLSIIVALFPKSLIYEAISTIMVLKTGLCGLSFSIYLYKTRPINSIGFGMFSVMYALCAFATAYQSNIMWIDALIYLPLIALGIELLIKNGDMKLFIISLSLAIWSNYYIGYMLCIFTLIYFVFFLSSHSKQERNPNGVKLHTLKSIGRYILAGIVALLLSAVTLFSAIYSLGFGKANFDLSKLGFEFNVNILEIISKLYIGTFDTFRAEGFPHIYAGTLMLLLLPAFFVSKRIKLRQKIGYAVLSLVFIVSFSINPINLVWHCFNEPVWLNYRYSFIFSFILLIMAYKSYEVLSSVKFKFFACVSGFLIAILILVRVFVTFTRYDGDDKIDLKLHWGFIALSIALILGYLAIIFFLEFKKKLVHTLSLVLCIIVSCEALAGACISWVGQYSDAGWSTRSNYITFKKNNECIEEFLSNQYESDAFFRAERLFQRKTNDNLALNINGISEFTSTFNKGSKTFLKKLGYTTKDQSSLYSFNNELSDSLLGIKYIISDEIIQESKEDTDTSNKAPSYEIIKDNGIYKEIEVLDERYTVYENEYALSIAYVVSPKIKEATLDKQMSAEDYALYIAGLMTEHNYGSNLLEYKLKRIYNELKDGQLEVSEFSDTRVKGTITSDDNKVVFTTIPYDKMWQVYVDGERVDTFKCIDSMLAFDIDAGEHEIEMKYVPQQFYFGIIVSMVGAISFLSICLIDINKKNSYYKKLLKKEAI